MRSGRFSLRIKLFMLAGLPLVAMIGVSALAVQQALADRDRAEAQLIQVDGATILADLAQAVRNERVVTTSSMGSVVLPNTRANTDATFAAATSSPALSTAVKSTVATVWDDVAGYREKLGSDFDDIQGMMESETPSGATEATDILIGYGNSAIRLSDLIETNPEKLGTAASALDLVSFKVINQFEESVRAEIDAYLSLNGSETPAARTSFAFAVQRSGATSQLEERVQGLGNPAFAPSLAEILASERYEELRNLRDRVATAPNGNQRISPAELLPIRAELTSALSAVKADVRQNLIDTAIRNRDAAQNRLIGTAGFTVLLSVIGLLLSGALYRSIRRPIVTLTARSKSIANEELPAVVALMREIGSDAELPAFVPIESPSNDEIGQLVLAFNEMHSTALNFAAQQAASRRTVADMFVNLGRRNQKLLMRLLSHLDSLERREEDPAILEELFKVDHLATRMRRNAESLLVLAGARSTRSFSQPVAVGDLFRSTLAEVEEFARVDIVDDTRALVDGKVVADLGHLLAELVENALQFSPPESSVDLIAQDTEAGYVISVVDRGVGMKQAELAEANARIDAAAKLTETPSKYLGHYVVGRLISRHGLSAELLEGFPTGLVARVGIPDALIRRQNVHDGGTSALDARPELRTPKATPTSEAALGAWSQSAEPAQTQPAETQPAQNQPEEPEFEPEVPQAEPAFVQEPEPVQVRPPVDAAAHQEPPAPVGGPGQFVPGTRRRGEVSADLSAEVPERPSAIVPTAMDYQRPVFQKRATDPERGSELPPPPDRPNARGIPVHPAPAGEGLAQRRRSSDAVAAAEPVAQSPIFSAQSRRSPGASLSGEPGAIPTPSEEVADSISAKEDPETVGWNLAGFQQAVNRADRVRPDPEEPQE